MQSGAFTRRGGERRHAPMRFFDLSVPVCTEPPRLIKNLIHFLLLRSHGESFDF